MEGRLAEIEEVVKKFTAEVESLQKENNILKARNRPSRKDIAPSQADRAEMKAHSTRASKPP